MRSIGLGGILLYWVCEAFFWALDALYRVWEAFYRVWEAFYRASEAVYRAKEWEAIYRPGIHFDLWFYLQTFDFVIGGFPLGRVRVGAIRVSEVIRSLFPRDEILSQHC